jgi:2,3-dihydroxyphenylpropionate 1,2-dioxygenase
MTSSPARLSVCVSHSPIMDSVDGGEPGSRFLAAVDNVSGIVREFDPGLVVFFGADHLRAFPSVVPAFAVVKSAVGFGDYDTPTDPYDVPSKVADRLAGALLASGFDAAAASDIRLDHGFGKTYVQLFGSLGAVPTIPIFVNCAKPPLPTIARTVEFGRTVGEFFAAFQERILFVGSGGLSHNPPLPSEFVGMDEPERSRVQAQRMAEASRQIRPDWDNRFLAMIERDEWDVLSAMGNDLVLEGGRGAQEVRTWLAASAAVGGTGRRFAYEAVPEWITGMGILITEEAGR